MSLAQVPSFFPPSSKTIEISSGKPSLLHSHHCWPSRLISTKAPGVSGQSVYPMFLSNQSQEETRRQGDSGWGWRSGFHIRCFKNMRFAAAETILQPKAENLEAAKWNSRSWEWSHSQDAQPKAGPVSIIYAPNLTIPEARSIHGPFITGLNKYISSCLSPWTPTAKWLSIETAVPDAKMICQKLQRPK